MNVELRSDFPVTDEACREATGKTLTEWSDLLIANGYAKRRESTNWLWDQTGRNPAGAWWGITIWVEHERRIGRLAKDGRIEGYGICSTKTIAAAPETVLAEIAKSLPTIVRLREGKDIKAKWSDPTTGEESDVEVVLAANAGKTAVTLNHNRIQTREEADGLRRAWSQTLADVKKRLES